jgi:predicted phage tail protein
MTGCQLLTGIGGKIASLGDRLDKNKGGDTSGTVAGAQATSNAVDRMTEIARREAEARKAMEIRYEKFRQELADAYAKREKIDNDNFDKISAINYGITFATEEITGLDKRVLIANLKSKEAAVILMPVPEGKKKEIEADITADRQKAEDDIRKKYSVLLKQSEEDAKRYAEADKLVKQKEEEKSKIRSEQAESLKKLQEEQEAFRAKMKKEADDAVEIAKEKQKQEMVGMIVKALLGVGIVLMVLGFLLKSPVFIIGGLVMLGLSYVAATIPFWVVGAVMGLFVVVMAVMSHKKGGGSISPFAKKKEDSTPPAPPAPPAPTAG